MSRKHKEGLGRRGLRGFSRVFAVVPPPKSRLVDLSVGRGDALCCARPNAFMEEAGFGPGGRTCTREKHSPPRRGTAIAPIAAGRPVAVPRPGRGRHRAGGDGAGARRADRPQRREPSARPVRRPAGGLRGIDLRPGAGLAGLLRRSRKRHLALAGIVLNLSCLLWGWHALSTAAAAILVVLGQTGLSFLSALAVLFGMIFFRQA